jgi:hypothetical protein
VVIKKVSLLRYLTNIDNLYDNDYIRVKATKYIIEYLSTLFINLSL